MWVPTTSWKIDGEKMEEVTDIIFLGSKITADGDCTQEIKRGLFLLFFFNFILFLNFT